MLICPKCKSKNIKKFIYGLVDSGGYDDNKYIPGGCVVLPDNMDYHCDDCNYEWDRKHPSDGHINDEED